MVVKSFNEREKLFLLLRFVHLL